MRADCTLSAQRLHSANGIQPRNARNLLARCCDLVYNFVQPLPKEPRYATLVQCGRTVQCQRPVVPLMVYHSTRVPVPALRSFRQEEELRP